MGRSFRARSRNRGTRQDLLFKMPVADLTARALRADGYDFRFVCVRPVLGSMGAEMCVWMTFHWPSTLWKTSVTRTVTSCGLPALSVQAKCWMLRAMPIVPSVTTTNSTKFPLAPAKLANTLLKSPRTAALPLVLQRPGKIVNVDIVLVVILHQVVGVGGCDHLVFNIPDRILILG